MGFEPGQEHLGTSRPRPPRGGGRNWPADCRLVHELVPVIPEHRADLRAEPRARSGPPDVDLAGSRLGIDQRDDRGQLVVKPEHPFDRTGFALTGVPGPPLPGRELPDRDAPPPGRLQHQFGECPVAVAPLGRCQHGAEAVPDDEQDQVTSFNLPA